MNHARYNLNARQGTVMLIALIVLSATIISSVGLATLIVNSLQQTRVLDQAATAFYAAETGAEEAIWEVRKSAAFDAALPNPIPDPQHPAIKEVVQVNGAAWSRDVQGDEDEIRLAIPRDSFFEINLFEPAGGRLGHLDETAFARGIDHLEVDWAEPDGCVAADNCPVLFAEWVRWNPNSLDADPTDPLSPGVMVFSKRYRKVDLTGPARIPPIEDKFPASLQIPTYAYRLRLRAEYADMRNVVITAKDNLGDKINIPGRVKVDAWGRYGDTYQKLSVRIPRKTPLSSLFDFAVFSECSLVKGYPISCP